MERHALRLLPAVALSALVAVAAPALAPRAALADVASGASSVKVDIPFTKRTLPNGLTVILHEDHALPFVAVNAMVKVGSRFEEPGRTGFAHLFEHLMFMGTRRAPTKMFDAWMEAEGGSNNAWTSEDRTDYYEVGPTHSLPLLLWLEADRFSSLGQEMTQEKLDAQRAVVLNERRQSYENQPYARVVPAAAGAAVPRGAPLPPPRHRLPRGPAGGDGGRREGVLLSLVRAEQHLARGRGRHRPGQSGAGDSIGSSGGSRGRRSRPTSRPPCPR